MVEGIFAFLFAIEREHLNYMLNVVSIRFYECTNIKTVPGNSVRPKHDIRKDVRNSIQPLTRGVVEALAGSAARCSVPAFVAFSSELFSLDSFFTAFFFNLRAPFSKASSGRGRI